MKTEFLTHQQASSPDPLGIPTTRPQRDAANTETIIQTDEKQSHLTL